MCLNLSCYHLIRFGRLNDYFLLRVWSHPYRYNYNINGVKFLIKLYTVLHKILLVIIA